MKRLNHRGPASVQARHSNRAFSLIEVVIAVALFAMAATILSSTFVNALLVRDRVQSNDVREADIRAVRLQLLLEANIDDAEEGDRIETLNNGEATWRAEIEPTEVIDLFHVQFFVEFLDPQEEQSPTYQETLYLLRPTWSQADERSSLLQDKKEALLDSRDFDRF